MVGDCWGFFFEVSIFFILRLFESLINDVVVLVC